ncbi:MAG: pitrilysin family protein [Bdellovibrionota bacterium]|nr:pitrilysin family protein [Bdellovibrionota bacterium]
MKRTLLFVGLFLFAGQIQAKGFPAGKVKKLKWQDLDVIYLEDDRFPTYDINIYFADGALSEGRVKGLTDAAFSYLDLGTRRFSRQDISSNLEFFGAEYGGRVTHEYASYHISGLAKDVVPTMKKICHLFQDATFPDRELKKEKKRILDSLDNIESNPGALASRAFREISLQNTPYSYPAEGKKSDIKKWNSKLLKGKLSYFSNEVKKRIYLTGPKSVLNIEKVITNECGWKGQGQFQRTVSYKAPSEIKRPRITLIPLKGANQAQVRIGRFLNEEVIKEEELMSLSAHYLGGGFTSRLMRVLRVENGLTYGVGAFAGGQKQYGRSGVSTSTKVESLETLLLKTKETLEKAASGKIEDANLLRAQGSLAGSYPFGFESNSAYLAQLSYLDHKGVDYSELFKFPERVRSFSKEEVSQKIKDIFTWNEQDIIIVGPKKLSSMLKKMGDLRILPLKKFL